MKKVLFAAVLGLALCAMPNSVLAGPPGFYSGGTIVTPYSPVTPFAIGPTVTNYNTYASPYGVRTVNAYSYTPTPFGWVGAQTGGTYVRPYYSGPYHSVYWNPWANTYQYGPGFANQPAFVGFGW